MLQWSQSKEARTAQLRELKKIIAVSNKSTQKTTEEKKMTTTTINTAEDVAKAVFGFDDNSDQLSVVERFEIGEYVNLNGELIDEDGEYVGLTPENAIVDDCGRFEGYIIDSEWVAD